MNILVLNKNIVVSKLISLSIEEFNANITEVESLPQIEYDKYDVVFIDDSIYNIELVDFIKNNISSTKILLYSDENHSLEDLNYDFKIKKPFLPTTIVDILNKIINRDKEESNDLSLLLDYDDTKPDDIVDKSDKNQLGNIEEFSIDDSLDDIDSEIFKERDNHFNNINGDELLNLLLDTKIEALKDVFAGAKINISIEFPKDNI